MQISELRDRIKTLALKALKNLELGPYVPDEYRCYYCLVEKTVYQEKGMTCPGCGTHGTKEITYGNGWGV